MTVLLIGIAIAAGTLIWPVNRWVARNGGRPQAYGFWASGTVLVLAACGAYVTGQSLRQPLIWQIGALIASTGAIGFYLAIMRCLRIGPVGPTAAMNNMGLVWPVVLGAVWLKPHPLGGWALLGLALVSASIICFGLHRAGPAGRAKAPGVSAQWLPWALLGWTLAGCSMTGQLLGSIRVPASPVALAFVCAAVTIVLVTPFVLRLGATWCRRSEVVAGVASGFLSLTQFLATLTALTRLRAEVVFPFTVAGPLLLVLMIGRFLYHERLDVPAWAACFSGVGGLVALSMSQAA